MRTNKVFCILFVATLLFIVAGCGPSSPPPDTSARDATEQINEVPTREQAEEATTYGEQGNDYMRQGEYTKAIAAYSQAIELDPQYVSAYFGRGYAYHMLGKYEAAIADYERVIRLDPDHDVALNNLAYLYADALETNLAEATDLAQRALELEGDGPNRGTYLDTLGWVYYKRGMLNEAYEALEEAIELVPDASEIVEHWEATIAALEEVTEDAAAQATTTAIAQATAAAREKDSDGDGVPDYEEATTYGEQGNDYMRQGEYTKAIAAYSQAIELDPQYVSAYFGRGYAYHLLGKYEAAIADYERVIRLDPDYDVALNNLAYLYADALETNLAEATDLAQRALELEGDGPNRGIYLDTLGWVYYKRGMLDEAYEALEEAIELVPNASEIVEHRKATIAALEEVTEEVAAQATATAQAAAQQAAIQATATAQAAAQQAAVQATATAIAQATAAAREKDSDGDGVPDYLDQCPGAILGTSGDVDQTGCPTRFDPYAGLSFEPGDHGNWYRHFWEGKCKGLGFFSGCRTFEGYWSIAEQAVSDVSSQDRGRLRNRLWALGRKIGYEWARDNDKRCITTEHVFTGDNAWGPRLENSNASNLEQVINAIEKEANYKLEHPPSERHCLSRP